MQVVNGEQDRAVDTQVDGEPIEPVHGRKRGVDVVAIRAQLEHCARCLGRSHERGLIVSGERGLKELASDAEWELALQLPAPRAQDTHVRGGRPSSGLGQQPGLADARRALDEPDASLLGDGRVDQGLKRRELLLPLQQTGRVGPIHL